MRDIATKLGAARRLCRQCRLKCDNGKLFHFKRTKSANSEGNKFDIFKAKLVLCRLFHPYISVFVFQVEITQICQLFGFLFGIGFLPAWQVKFRKKSGELAIISLFSSRRVKISWEKQIKVKP